LSAHGGRKQSGKHQKARNWLCRSSVERGTRTRSRGDIAKGKSTKGRDINQNQRNCDCKLLLDSLRLENIKREEGPGEVQREKGTQKNGGGATKIERGNDVWGTRERIRLSEGIVLHVVKREGAQGLKNRERLGIYVESNRLDNGKIYVDRKGVETKPNVGDSGLR